MALEAGEQIKDYRIAKRLSRGTLSQTYLALDTRNQQEVIVKELLLQDLADWKQLELFAREARTLKALEHPGIPRLIEDFQDQDGSRLFLVSEKVPGQSLLEKLEQGWKPSEKEVLALARQVLEILSYLQNLQPPVVHRDLKPSNLMLSESGEVYLIDFGAVQDLLHPEGSKTVVGTFGYMAPEQFSGQAEPASDLYGLGATLVHLCSGRPPSQLPRRGQELSFQEYVHLSPKVTTWLEHLLHPHVSQRYRDAHEALQALDAMEKGKSPTIPLRHETLPPQRSRKGLLILSGSLLALSLMGLTGLFWALAKKTPPPQPAGYASNCFTQKLPPAVSDQSPEADNFRQDFQARFPLPETLQNLEVPVFDNLQGLLDYWRCDSRSKQQFFKSAYLSLLARPLNDEMVVQAIDLMPLTYSDYPQLQTLLEFGLKNYYYFQSHDSMYSGKSGDQVAGIALKLAELYNKQPNYPKTIELLKRFLDERKKEINDHMLQLMSWEYTYAVWKQGDPGKAKEILKQALHNYPEGSWDKKLNKLLTAIEKSSK